MEPRNLRAGKGIYKPVSAPCFLGSSGQTPIKLPSLSFSSAMNPEKLEIRSGFSKEESVVYDSGLNDSQEGTLHRGLKARQISMIAVRRLPTYHLDRFPFLCS